jgi:hypothetical protein
VVSLTYKIIEFSGLFKLKFHWKLPKTTDIIRQILSFKKYFKNPVEIFSKNTASG